MSSCRSAHNATVHHPPSTDAATAGGEHLTHYVRPISCVSACGWQTWPGGHDPTRVRMAVPAGMMGTYQQFDLLAAAAPGRQGAPRPDRRVGNIGNRKTRARIAQPIPYPARQVCVSLLPPDLKKQESSPLTPAHTSLSPIMHGPALDRKLNGR